MSTYKGFLIYGLKDPFTQEIRYIGRSSSGLKRPGEHMRPHKLSQKSHKSSWIKSVMFKGAVPEIVILETTDSQENLNPLEKKWILEFKKRGSKLVNHTDGGDGIHGFRHSEESKKKIAEASRKMNMDKSIVMRRTESSRKAMKSETVRLKFAKAKGQKPFQVFDPEKKFIGIWESIEKCSRDLSLDSASVWRVLKGHYHHTKGYFMKYPEMKTSGTN